jgi:hypothetical protein
MRGLGRRAAADAVVLSVDHHGILDQRLMSKHITWQEIEAICPVDTDRSYVVDIELRWPKETLGEARWPVRIGAYCQMAYGVPAITISMLLLDGNVCDLLNAVAQYDLIFCTAKIKERRSLPRDARELRKQQRDILERARRTLV